MIQKKIQTNLVLFVIFCLVLYITGQVLIGFVNEEKEVYKKINVDFSSEIFKSLSLLSSTMSELVRELENKKNFNLSHQNSTKRFLSSYLRLGQLDGLQFFSSSCQLIVNSSLYNKPINQCVKGNIKNYFISTYKDYPVIILNKTIRLNNKLYFVQGHLYLNKSWLRVRPLLEKELGLANIVLRSQKPSSNQSIVPVFHYFKQHENQHNISLWTDDYFYALLSPLLRRGENISFRTFDFLIIIILLVLLLLFFISKRSYKTEKKSYLNFEKWCHNNLVMSQKELYSVCLNKIRKSETAVFSQIYKASSEVISKKLQDNFNLQAKIRKLEKSVEILQQEKLALTYQNKCFDEFNSLVKQVSQLAPKAFRNLEDTNRLNNDVSNIINQSLLKNCNLILYQLEEWKNQGNAVGMKKYMRSLDETKGTTEGISMLEEQIDFFVNLISRTKRQLQHCSDSLYKISDKKNIVSSSIKHWLNYVNREYKDSNDIATIEVIRGAEKLYKIYDSQIELDVEKVNPSHLMPKHADTTKLLSSFYHIFDFCCYERNSSEKLFVTLKSSLKNDRNSLLISCDSHLSQKGFAEAQKLLDIAKNLLKNMGISQNILNLENNPYIINLEWQHQSSNGKNINLNTA